MLAQLRKHTAAKRAARVFAAGLLTLQVKRRAASLRMVRCFALGVLPFSIRKRRGAKWCAKMFAAAMPVAAVRIKNKPPPPVKAKKAKKAKSKAPKKDPNAPKMKALFWDALKKPKQTKGMACSSAAMHG